MRGIMFLTSLFTSNASTDKFSLHAANIKKYKK